MKPRYLTPGIYTADPSAHVFEDKIYIYPSHDIESGIPENDLGDHFTMRDYHVFSLSSPDGVATDLGVALDLEAIPWAGRQLWAPDAACKNGRYYLYFPLKDKNDVFRIGVATSDRPEGPFAPEDSPIKGSYSIDPAVLEDDGNYFIYFGGLWGGQLQCYRENRRIENGEEPADGQPALCPKVAQLSEDMLQFGEAPRDVVILDEQGRPLRADDHDRRYFEGPWVHRYQGTYYFSYSSGNTHRICYATSDNPYGPFTYRGVILTPVVGWTTHHSICQFNGKWWLFYHDSVPSGGKTWLRSMKIRELHYRADGSILTMDGMD